MLTIIIKNKICAGCFKQKLRSPVCLNRVWKYGTWSEDDFVIKSSILGNFRTNTYIKSLNILCQT